LLGHEAHHPPLSSVEAKNGWNYTTKTQGMHGDDFTFLKYNHIEGLLNLVHMGHVLNTVSGRKV